jgi:hypothetical protein
MVLASGHDVGNYFTALLNGGTFGDERVISQASLDKMWRPPSRSVKRPVWAWAGAWPISEVCGF